MYLLALGILFMSGCDRFFYYPNAVRYARPEQYRLRYEPVRFPSRDGTRLSGWFFPAEGTARGTVLHLHGNAGNITGHFQHTAWLPAKGWNVFEFDYRGYGESAGRVTRDGTVMDAHAALDYLLTRPDVDRGRIVAFGQSLGGAIGIVLTAARPEIRGLATDGAFDSYRRIAKWHIRRSPLLLCVAWWVPNVLMSATHDPIEVVGRISPRPLFIMHGTADQVVDPAMARSLYEAAREPKELWLIEGADHYGALDEHGEEARARLVRFFEKCVGEAMPAETRPSSGTPASRPS